MPEEIKEQFLFNSNTVSIKYLYNSVYLCFRDPSTANSSIVYAYFLTNVSATDLAAVDL